MANPGVRWNFKDAKRLQRYLDRLDPGKRASVSDAVMVDLGKLVKADVQENQIIRNRGEHAPPLPTRLTWRTGHLTRSIGTDNSGAPKRYVVGTPVRYGPQHELGLKPYRRRAFLEPAAQKVVPRDAPKLFRKALTRAQSRP